MAQNVIVFAMCLGLSTAAASAASAAAGPAGFDSVMRHYDAAAVAEGEIQISTLPDVAYVSGTSAEGPWLDVWRRLDGEWKRVAEIAMNELKPIRFGAKRDRSCRRIS